MGVVNGKLLNENAFHYEWEIRRFDLHRVSSPWLLSPAFVSKHSVDRKWRLKFYPRSMKREFHDYSSIFLEYLGEEEVAISLKFSIINNNYTVFAKNASAQKLCRKCDTHGLHDFIEFDHYLLRSQNLVIRCDVAFHQLPIFPKLVRGGTNEDSDMCVEYKLEGDLEKLFKSEIFSDVTVTIGDKRKSLHKAILASRSEVFAAMFQHDMIEREQNNVNIDDISFEVAMEMFGYMYTGKVNNIENLAVDELLTAADKYCIHGLKIMCERILCQDLNFDNSLSYLALAALHNAAYLKRRAIAYVIDHLEKYVDKPEFKNLDQSVMCELLSASAAKKIQR